MSLRFHLATLDDLPIWKSLREALYDDLEPEWSEDEIRRIVEVPYMTTFLIYQKNDLVGMLELSLRNIVDGCQTSPVAYIDGFFVLPPWQGKGLGKDILAFCKSWAKEQGCSELGVDTELDNERAQGFYLKNGFEETFRIVQYKMEV